MFEQEKQLFKDMRIDIDTDGEFPYAHISNYLKSCNNLKDTEEVTDQLQLLKEQVGEHVYELTMVFGSMVDLSKKQMYNFMRAMLNDRFRDHVKTITEEFELYQHQIESITRYRFC